MINNHHQNPESVFSRQASRVIVQILPTPGSVPTGKAASAKATYGQTRLRPLYVRPDVQGASAPVPADLKGKRPDRSVPSGQAHVKELQVNREITQISEKQTENRTPHIVRQDKRRLTTARPASAQPAADTKSTRAADPYNGGVRSKNVSELSQKNSRITLWGIDPPLKAELERIARRDGISLSAAGVAFLRRALQRDIDLEYTATLEPMFERILARYLNNRDSRVISLLVRIAFDSGQTRSIVTNILGLQPDITPSLLREIIEESDKRAKTNITRKTPQITELMEALNKWFFETNREESSKN